MFSGSFGSAARLEPIYKSVGGDGHAVTQIGTGLFSSNGVFSPVMVAKRDALVHNLTAMSDYCREEGVELAPHGKTSMSPELCLAQVAAGAWGISAATPSQVRVFHAFGVQNVLLANELVDPAGIRWIAEYQNEHPGNEFYCYVDSVDGVDLLERELLASGLDVVIDVLLEIGSEGGRTGARDHSTALAVANAALEAPHLRLIGIAGYEGALVSDRRLESMRRVREYCEVVGVIAADLDQARMFQGPNVVLSVGGGAFFDVVVSALKSIRLPFSRPRIVIRAGAYLSHDEGLYSRIAAFAQPGASHSLLPALELWARVLSRPERTLAFLDFGRRDAPFDQGLPTPHSVRTRDGLDERRVRNFEITALNDQHAYLRIPAEDRLAPGDWVASGISHPCTSFDKWRYLPLVDDDYTVVGAITTYF